MDSNLDWGQDLPALAAVMDEKGIETVNLAYFGKAVPEKYGVRYQPLPGYLRFMDGIELNAYNPYTPEPGWYAISATSLRLGLTLPGSEDLYAYFRGREPDGRAGYSIYLYHVQDEPGTEVARRVVNRHAGPGGECGGARSSAGAARAGQVEARRRHEDLHAGRGFYAARGGLSRGGGELRRCVHACSAIRWSRGKCRRARQASLTLYWEKGPAAMAMPAPTRAAPLSAFVHVLDGAGATVAQYDGWDTALRGLEPGDVIAQTIDIPLGEGLAAGEYAMEAGLYSPQDGVRLQVGTADYVELGAIDLR